MSTPIETITDSTRNSANNLQKENQILAEKGFYWREKDGVKILVCRFLEEEGFDNGFSTRLGGVSPLPEKALNLAGYDEDSAANIEENRRRFLQGFARDFRLSTVWQVHGDGVKVIEKNEDAENTDEKFDALTSNLENLLVGVKTADCVPVLIGDTQTKSFAAIHAGWRGTVQSIVFKTVEKMRETFGVNPANLICAIGPAATCQNYEVGQDVIDAFAENFPRSAHLFQQTREGHALIDLHRANREQLTSIGVAEENIFNAPFCTMERNDLFFSYRLEKKSFGKTGRLLSVIGRK